MAITEGVITDPNTEEVTTPNVSALYEGAADQIAATPTATTSTYKSPFTVSPTGQLQGQPVATASEEYVTPETTVQGQLEKILSTDSPLQTLAKTQAKEQASALGMSSSSMAVGAAQKALYESALPIAQQDATTAASFKQQQQALDYEQTKIETEAQVAGALNLQKAQLAEQSARVEAGWQTLLSGVQSQAQMQQTALQGEISRQQALTQGGINAQLQEQQVAQQERLTQLEGTINMQLQKQQQDAQVLLQEVDSNLQKQLQQQQIDANVQTTIMNQSQEMLNNYQITIQQLLGNQAFLESMPDSAAMNSLFNDMFATVSSAIQFNVKASGTYTPEMQSAINEMVAANQW